MRNLKRVFSLALALVMVLGMMVIGTSAATFTDAKEITYTEAVEVMSALGILKGYEEADGTFTFNPTGTLTRAEAAKILAFVCLGDEADDYLAGSAAPFTDVKATNWAAKYVAFCKNAKIINGVNAEQTVFNPAGTLKVVEFAKMLLVAAGIEGTYTGAGWDANVKNAFNNNSVLKATGIEITHDLITREEACQLALAAMKAGGTTTTYYYVVDSGVTTPLSELAKLAAHDVFTSLSDAYVTANLMNAAPGTSVKVVPTPETTGTLLEEVYGWNYVAEDTDAFGRPAVSYNNGQTDPTKYVEQMFVEEADYTITLTKDYTGDLTGLTALVTDVIKATGVKKMNATPAINGGKVVVDGKPVAAGNDALFVAMAPAAKAGTVVELYMAADGLTVADIIVTVTYADTVKKVTEADAEKEIDASIELAGGLTYKTDKFAEDDVVVYTKAWNGSAYAVQTIAKAESFTGTLSSYTNKGEYTFGEKTYKLSSVPVSGFDSADIIAQYDEEFVWYLGADGKLIYGHAPKGAAPVVIKDYALITDTAVVAVKDAFQQVSSMTAHVKATLSDGSNGTFELPIKKATTGEHKGQFVYNIGLSEVVVASDATNVNDLKNNLFTYSVADGVITLASKVAVFTGSETKSGAAWHYTKEEASKTSTTIVTHGGTVLANETTVFVLKTTTGYEIKTGIASLEDTKIPAGSLIIVDVNYSAKGNTNVAAVVYATGTSFDDAAATSGTNDYVYVDGTYTVTKDARGNYVYTATGVKADGSEISVTAANKAEGIYKFNSAGELADVKSVTEVAVGTIAGTTYQLGDQYLTVNGTTKVVVIADEAVLEKGAKVFYLDANSDKVVDLIYVTEAAPEA